jgi:hypothetical protein
MCNGYSSAQMPIVGFLHKEGILDKSKSRSKDTKKFTDPDPTLTLKDVKNTGTTSSLQKKHISAIFIGNEKARPKRYPVLSYPDSRVLMFGILANIQHCREGDA